MLLVEDAQSKKPQLIGYSLAVDVALGDRNAEITVRPLLELRENESLIGALRTMQTADEDIALVIGSRQQPRGVVTVDDLVDPLLRGGI